MREENSENRTCLLSRLSPDSLTKFLLLHILVFVSVQKFVAFSRSLICLTCLFYKYLFLVKLVLSVSFRTIMCFNSFFLITLGSYFAKTKQRNNNHKTFFYLRFLSRTFTIHRTAGEARGYLFNSSPSLPLPSASQTLRHWPGDYCRDLTSIHNQQPDSNREPLVSERKLLKH